MSVVLQVADADHAVDELLDLFLGNAPEPGEQVQQLVRVQLV